jgi:NAD(P)-dependent dehydrogenase (short-subunit alcohol dehydrogenase family)
MVEGKVVIVTGGGRGIGREVALSMAAEGAAVVVNDLGTSAAGDGRDPGPARDVAALIQSRGGRALADAHDVSSREEAAALVDAAIEGFGRLDCVVNNAGILRDRIFHRLGGADFDAVIGVHLTGSYNVSHAAAPHFKAQESGSFVHMTSTSGLIGNVGQANYAAAKLGIVGLSRSIALDMSRYHVRSNCVAPFARTRMIATIPDDGHQEARLAALNALDPATIAPLIVFLASDRSADVSGQIFAVRGREVFLFSQPRPIRSMQADGGWTAARLADQFLPAVRGSLVPMETSGDVFNRDPE